MSQSDILFNQAKKYIPGGVNSPVRAFNGVGGNSIFFESGKGAHLLSVDGKKYIDYVTSWGAMILGHSNPYIIDQVKATLEKGLGFGSPTKIETLLAEKICELMPSIELVRMVNSGTEATMSAIRLARGYTNKDKIIKFDGCYHGHSDSLLIKSGSGTLTSGIPTSKGVPKAIIENTISLEYNNISQVYQALKNEDVACIIVEPIAGNMNCVLPIDGFLQGLRKACDEYGVVLIFDEVMTGFRVDIGGAQTYYQVKPDLTTLGKIIGGGLPVGAFGGKREIMEFIAPMGPVYQAGTLSGNPISMTAGLAMLNILSADNNFYKNLSIKTNQLTSGIISQANKYGIDIMANTAGGMFGLFFTELDQVTNLNQVEKCDIELFKKFFHLMLKEGIYMAPSAYEAGFITSMHSDEDIDFTINAAKAAFASLKK
jgi:glutamate-1-semialdehyde 2,1-aminomutase